MHLNDLKRRLISKTNALKTYNRLILVITRSALKILRAVY